MTRKIILPVIAFLGVAGCSDYPEQQDPVPVTHEAVSSPEAQTNDTADPGELTLSSPVGLD